MTRCFFLLLLILGCSSPPTRPPVHKKAFDLSIRAEKAFKAGRIKNAISFYQEALKINRSIENIPSIAQNLINLAIVYRFLDQVELAHKHIDEVLQASFLIFPDEKIIEAAILKSLLFIKAQKYILAQKWIEKALLLCQKNCLLKGKIYNIKARLALLLKQPQKSLEYSLHALDQNQENATERANSHRLIADAQLLLKKQEQAQEHYKKALEIDKELGFSKKIALALLGLGKIAMAKKKWPQAHIYFQRALAVSKAGEYSKGIEIAKKMIKLCRDK